MKQFGFLFFLWVCLAKPGQGQNRVIPSADLLIGSTIRPEQQQAVWYEWKGTTRRELATLTTTIEPDYQGNKILIIQEVTPTGAPGPSKIDTTIVLRETLAPVYHASFDGQHELVLRFNGRNVIGFSRMRSEQPKPGFRMK